MNQEKSIVSKCDFFMEWIKNLGSNTEYDSFYLKKNTLKNKPHAWEKKHEKNEIFSQVYFIWYRNAYREEPNTSNVHADQDRSLRYASNCWTKKKLVNVCIKRTRNKEILTNNPAKPSV